jgi:hypothetical protein
MSPFISEFSFKKSPKKITYLNGPVLNLTNELSFYHNKNRFRKELTRLQLIFKNYINQTIPASGIRDTYLNEEYSENYLIVILTNNETIKEATKIVETTSLLKFDPGCFYIESKSDNLLLLAKDMNGLVSGIDYLEDILTQVLEDYLKQNNFEEYIQIRQFNLSNC